MYSNDLLDISIAFTLYAMYFSVRPVRQYGISPNRPVCIIRSYRLIRFFSVYNTLKNFLKFWAIKFFLSSSTTSQVLLHEQTFLMPVLASLRKRIPTLIEPTQTA